MCIDVMHADSNNPNPIDRTTRFFGLPWLHVNTLFIENLGCINALHASKHYLLDFMGSCITSLSLT